MKSGKHHSTGTMPKRLRHCKPLKVATRALIQSRFVKKLALAICTSLAVALPAGAQELTLKFAHQFPAAHYLWTYGGEVFVNKVEEASEGEIKFQVYPAAQLGKNYFNVLDSGLVDLAIIIPSYAADKLPMSSVGELPGMFSSACEGAGKFWGLTREGGILGNGEYKAQGLHVLFVTTFPLYSLLTTDKQTPTLESVKGLKIRTNGGAAMTKTASALGAVPVPISGPETYDALSRGTVDGAIYPYNGVPQYNLEETLKYSVDGPGLGSSTIAYAISEKTWNKLTADQQDMLTKAASAAQESMCQWMDAENDKVQKSIVAEHGHVITKLNPEERARWAEKLHGIAEEWAADMDKTGRPGSEVLRAYRNASVVTN